MKRLVILCLMLLFLCSCTNQATERTDVKINLPKDNTVNGYRTVKEDMPDTISKSEVSVDNNVTVTTKLCGNKNSKIYHKTTCSSAKKMSDSNKVSFSSAQEFKDNGYKPCKLCNP